MLLNHALLTHVPTNLDELEVVVRHASAQCGLMEREQKHVTPELNSKSFSENGGMPKAGMKELVCQNKFEKLLRKHLREKRNKRIEQILAEFTSLNRLHDVQREPVRR